MATDSYISGLISKPASLFKATGPQVSATTPVQSNGGSFGVKAISPTTNISKPITTLPTSQTVSKKIDTPSVDTNYYMNPGESTEAYNTRIGQYNASKNGTSTSTNNTDVSVNPTSTSTSTSSQTGSIPTYPGLIGGLIKQADQGSPAVQDAIKRQQDLETQIKAQYGNIESQAIPLEFQQGREQVLARQYAGQEAAAATGVQNALTAQGQTLGAYGTAIGASQPQLATYNQQEFNPLTGTFSGGGASDAAVAQQVAQIKAGKSVQQALSDLSAYGQPAVDALNKALGTNFNFNANAGAAASQQSNAQTTGTYGTNTAVEGGSAATQQYNQTNALYGAADTQAKTVQGILNNTGINSSNSSDYNKAINTLAGRLGSANYTQFTTALTELQTMYSNLLQSGGGTPSGNDAKSLALLSPTASAAQINGAIYQLQLAAQAKLTAQKGLADQYNGQLGVGSTGNTSGSAVQAGGYSFVQDASGKWVPAH